MSEYENIKTNEWKSEDITEIIKSLIKFQAETCSVKKNKVNPFFNSNYADINDILIAVRPLLVKHDLAITQGNNFCVETEGFYVTTTLLHASGQWIRTEVNIPLGENPNAQAVGSACTYGRRYGIASILGIATEPDDDANRISPKKRNRKVEPISDEDLGI